MVLWILAGIGAYLGNVYLASGLLLARIGPAAYMGPRDTLPKAGIYQERARKSAVNFMENLPVFLGLGVLALVVDGADQTLAGLGAQIFVLSRLAYMAVYVAGLPFIRSGIFTAGMAGMGIMAYALL
ncbi:MAG: MAPEG family protein [Pseudomonadota bacterium]